MSRQDGERPLPFVAEDNPSSDPEALEAMRVYLDDQVREIVERYRTGNGALLQWAIVLDFALPDPEDPYEAATWTYCITRPGCPPSWRNGMLAGACGATY